MSECPACDIARDMCRRLPPDKSSKCSEIIERVIKGEITGQQGRELLLTFMTQEELKKATEEALKNARSSSTV